MKPAATFRVLRAFEEDGKVQGRVVETTLDDLSPGGVVIKAAYSSVNYKDALASTGAGKIVRQFPRVTGIDVSGTVLTSTDGRFREGDQVLVTGYELGMSHDGGYAEYVRVPADWVVRVPAGLTLFEVMALGTAGFTAGLSILEIERGGVQPASGPVIVTGATGGVGTMAVQSLAARGYRVTALTGKDEEHDFLRSIGAADVLSRSTLQMGTRPLEKATWAGAVDAVGGDTLGWLTRTTMYRGVIASSGLTGGVELHTTVMPFILRAVRLVGIESSMCPMGDRVEVWRRLATDLKPRHLGATSREIGLDDLPGAFTTLLTGKARGRFVVRLEPGA